MVGRDPSGLRLFFEPRSVAVVGASTRPGKVGHETLRSLVNGRYGGRIYPINPRADEVLGLRAYPSLSELPEVPDMTVVVIPAEAAARAVEEAASMGSKAIVVISGGFAEVGGSGRDLQRRMVSAARAAGARIVGPNCIGVFDGWSGVDTLFQSAERLPRPPAGPLAFLSQSGTYGIAFLDWAAEEGLGVGRFVSLGNRADVDESDVIDFLSDDEKTSTIAVYVESFTDGRSLFEAVADCDKPVLFYLAGRTPRGARVARSHTGRMAARYEIASSALRQAGAFVARSFEGLYAAAKAVSLQPPWRDGGFAMVTNGAGPCVAAADAMQELDLPLATPSEETVRELGRRLPRYAIPGNPVDLTGSAKTDDYAESVEALASDDSVGLIGIFVVFQDTPLEDDFVEAVPGFEFRGKPVLVYGAGGRYAREKLVRLNRSGIPAYGRLDDLVEAARALRWAGARFPRGRGGGSASTARPTS